MTSEVNVSVKFERRGPAYLLRVVCEGTQETYCPTPESVISALKQYRYRLKTQLEVVNEQIKTVQAYLDDQEEK